MSDLTSFQTSVKEQHHRVKRHSSFERHFQDAKWTYRKKSGRAQKITDSRRPHSQNVHLPCVHCLMVSDLIIVHALEGMKSLESLHCDIAYHQKLGNTKDHQYEHLRKERQIVVTVLF